MSQGDLARFGDKMAPTWKPGESGNPEGQVTVGARTGRLMNDMRDLPEAELKVIANDKAAGNSLRTAAKRLLRRLESPDLADFEELIDGTKKLSELRAAGVNTEVIKKIKNGKDGLEVEVFDRGGQEFDRVQDYTSGKPSQQLDVTSDGNKISVVYTPQARVVGDEAAKKPADDPTVD